MRIVAGISTQDHLSLADFEHALRVVNKTQRSAPGQARDRRQDEKYGKVVQPRQEGFIRRS